MRQALHSEKETRSGRLVNLLNPDPKDIDIRDIAASLAYTARFGGHAGHYSNAQHSLLVANLLDEADRVHGLLHDASEYLIGDLGTPVKEALDVVCPVFRAAWQLIERAAETAIYTALGVELPTEEQRKRVKRADLVALATEQRDIMESPNLWNVPAPAPIRIRALTAGMAEVAFLDALAEVGVLVPGFPVAPRGYEGLAA